MTASDGAGDSRESAAQQQSLLDSLEEMIDSGESAREVVAAAADGLREVTGLNHVIVTVQERGSLKVLHASFDAGEREQIREYAGIELDGMALSRSAAMMLRHLAPAGPVLQICGTEDVAALMRALPTRRRVANLAADAVRTQGISSACAVPLSRNGEVFGAILASAYSQEALSEDDVSLIEEIATLVASVLASD